MLAGIRVVTCGPSETMSLVFLMRSAAPRAVAVLLLTRVASPGAGRCAVADAHVDGRGTLQAS